MTYRFLPIRNFGLGKSVILKSEKVDSRIFYRLKNFWTLAPTSNRIHTNVRYRLHHVPYMI